MNCLIRNISVILFCLLSFNLHSEREKVIHVYKNGEIINSFIASEIDYIQIDDFIESPQEVKASIYGESITLNWLPIDDATFSVYRSADNVNFGLLAEGIDDTSFTDDSPLIGSNFYRVIATVGSNNSEFSPSVEVSLTEPIQIADCSLAPIDLGVAVWKNNLRYFLTIDQYENADLEGACIEGLTVTSRTGNFIISPTLLNSTNVKREDALLYYYEVMPTQDQAITISARYQDINSALKRLNWTPFITEQSHYFYLTRTADYALELFQFSGGQLTQSNIGHIRGVSEIIEDSPIYWQAPDDMTLSDNRLIISIGNQIFGIDLHDAQSGSVVKDAALKLYADILPTKTQADIISMRYADINRRLQEVGGEAFHNCDYLTILPADSLTNFAINFSQFRDALVEPSSQGFIRGIINLNEPSDSLLTFSSYNITHSLSAAEDDPIGQLRFSNNPRNKDQLIYLERDGVFVTYSNSGDWNQRRIDMALYGDFDNRGIRPSAGQRFLCSQTGIKYTANDFGRLIPDGIKSDTISVTTWNIGGFNKGNNGTFSTTDSIKYQTIIRDFREVIDSIKSDMIGCCEFLPRVYGDNQIRDDLFSEFHFAAIPEIALEYQGKAVFSRFPLFNVHTFKVGQSIALEADVLISNQIYKICVLHPTWWISEIDNNLIELTELAQRYKYVDRVIMMGDFNVHKERESESWQLFTNSGFTLGNFGNFGAIPTAYNSVICSMSIDNIMVKGADILDVSTIQFTPTGLDPTMPDPADELLWDAVNPSDHFPFSAVIRTR